MDQAALCALLCRTAAPGSRVLLGSDQGDVGDQQPHQTLALAVRGTRVGLHGREVPGQGGDPGSLGIVEDCCAGMLRLFLGLGDGAA